MHVVRDNIRGVRQGAKWPQLVCRMRDKLSSDRLIYSRPREATLSQHHAGNRRNPTALLTIMDYTEKDKYDYGSKDVEPTAQVNVVAVGDGDGDDVRLDVHTKLYDGTKRNMKQRHMQMIALAGTLCVFVALPDSSA